jgi:hypothetical protein
MTRLFELTDHWQGWLYKFTNLTPHHEQYTPEHGYLRPEEYSSKLFLLQHYFMKYTQHISKVAKRSQQYRHKGYCSIAIRYDHWYSPEIDFQVVCEDLLGSNPPAWAADLQVPWKDQRLRLTELLRRTQIMYDNALSDMIIGLIIRDPGALTYNRKLNQWILIGFSTACKTFVRRSAMDTNDELLWEILEFLQEVKDIPVSY